MMLIYQYFFERHDSGIAYRINKSIMCILTGDDLNVSVALSLLSFVSSLPFRLLLSLQKESGDRKWERKRAPNRLISANCVIMTSLTHSWSFLYGSEGEIYPPFLSKVGQCLRRSSVAWLGVGDRKNGWVARPPCFTHTSPLWLVREHSYFA